ncbi:universal stress protein [Natronomonas sp. EA1]|uniref:universal stress protein n=1 Tax=Natronomonas sp. EA1 TaxID=3421655 RepID=UPI003EB9743F
MTILAAVNGERDVDRVVEVAADLADAYDDELVAVHVLSNEEFADRQDSTPNYYLEDAEENARNLVRRVARNTLDDAGGVTPRGVVGSVSESIVETARELEPRYLVIGGRKRSAVGKALFGSTTQDILFDAEVPVVTVMRREGDEA